MRGKKRVAVDKRAHAQKNGTNFRLHSKIVERIHHRATRRGAVHKGVNLQI